MVRFSTFPRTQTPPAFIERVIAVFERNSGEISTARPEKGLTSDEALAVLRSDLVALGLPCRHKCAMERICAMTAAHGVPAGFLVAGQVLAPG